MKNERLNKHIEKRKSQIEDIRTFFQKTMWDNELVEELSNSRQRLLKYLQALIVAVKTFNRHKIGFQCVALSYFCTLATIPLIALTVGVISKLGIDETILTESLADVIKSPHAGQIVETIMDGAHNILAVAENGMFGLFCALSFLWLVVWAMIQVERVFNNVWNAEASRKLWKRILALAVLVVIAPFLTVTLFSVPLAFSKFAQMLGVGFKLRTSGFIDWLLIYAFVVLIFSIMYKFIPAAHVKYKYAFSSALISGLFFIGLQYLYLNTQMFISRWNMILGAFALIPLFMIWLNFSWWVILVGSELCYGYQNIDQYIEQNSKEIE